MRLNKKELTVLCTILNGVNTKASTYNPFTKKYNIEQFINKHLDYKEIDLLHEKICNQLTEVSKQ